MNRIVLALLVVWLSALPTSAQQVVVNDPAELFPPDALLYVELTKPAAISDQVAALVRGSVLDDLPAQMQKWHGKHGARGFVGDTEMFGMFGSFLGPEMLAEVKRLQGAAVALTGVTKSGNPEVVGFVLSGDSNVPGFIMRVALATAAFRAVGQVEGVSIYREDLF